MLRHTIYIIASLVFAFGVLATSVLRTASPDFAFYQPSDSYSQKGFVSPVEYYLPYSGILPNHPLWRIKAARDKAWLILTLDPIKRAQLLLLFADKRIGMTGELIKKFDSRQTKNEEAGLGVSTAIKAEQYLEESFAQYEKAETQGMDTADFLQKVARASLKHREMLEELMTVAPADAKPVLVEIMNTPKRVYAKSVQELIRKRIDIPAEPEVN